MKKWGIVFMVIGVFLAFALIASSGVKAKGAPDKQTKGNELRAQYAPDRILIKYKDDLYGMLAEAGRAQVEFRHNLKTIKHFSRTGVHVYQTAGSIEEILKALKKDRNVAYAEPDYIQTLDVTIPDDASFGALWGMNNTGQTGGTPDADIDAPEAWDLTTGSSSVIVAVIDSGVDYTHPDLNANMWVNPIEFAGTGGVDDDANGYIDDIYGINSITGSGDPTDDNSHGTHCAGTIAAVGNNSIGVAGVCWTAKIMALKFLNASGSGYTTDAIECIEYAIDKGAHILSNSWGGGPYSQALKDAIDAAAAAGQLFCAAAGNYITDNDVYPHYPSSYLSPNIIAVAATDHNDILSIWTPGSTGSHWGAYSVDVAAPGTNIYSTMPGGSYDYKGGTSMATPHVSGLAALIKSYNFSLNWMQLRDRILSGADPKAALSGLMQTGARINAYNSLLAGDVTSYQLDIQSEPLTGVPITVSPADLDGYSSGTTNFTRRYAPYDTVTLTAPATFSGMQFGYWTLEGSRYSEELSISLPVDFNHTISALYFVPLADAIDNASLPVVTFGPQRGWMGQVNTYYTDNDAAQSPEITDNQYVTLQTSVIGPGDLTFYWKVSSESGVDLLTFSVDLTDQGTISGEVDWQQVSYPIGDGLHVIRWTYSKNDSGSSGSDCGWVDDVQFTGSPATLGQALDQQSLSCSTSEYAGWFPEPWTYQYDTDAVQSGYITHNEETSFMTSVEGPTPLSFYWKISSESGYDFLGFYIDGALQHSISGTVDWTLRSYSLEAGAHVLLWVYSKDVSISSGSDCGWVDHVEINPAGTYTLSLTEGGTGGGQVKVGGDPTPHDLPYAEAFAASNEIGIEAVPDSTSVFTAWSGDLVSSANPTSVMLDSSKSITANFESTLAPSITVTSPNGGESWPLMSTHAVTWTQTSLIGTVTIDLHKGGSFRKTLGTADATAGTFSWFISPSEPIGVDYRVVISQGLISDSSDADFSLEAASPILLQESFSGSTIPTGWTYQNEGTTSAWTVSLTSNAGGSPNEMRRMFSVGTLTRLVTPPLDTTSRSNVTLSFKHFFDTWSSGGGVLKVQTSPDGTNWTDETWTVTSGDSNIGPETVETTLTHNLDIATTYVGFVLAGNLIMMDYWYIDDVEISGEIIEENVTEDLLATWDGQGVYYRNSDTGAWVNLASPATMITCGDIDEDGIDDVIGLWPTQGGIWVKYSSTGAWAKLSSTAVHIASGDMNGDGRDDLLGTWDGQGVYYRDSATGAWIKMASPASLITTGDIDGDEIDDLIGIWPSQGGIWVKYSSSETWSRLSSTAVDFASGDMNGDDRDDLLATWVGQGVYYRDSITGAWVKMASEASQVTCGDLDADGTADLIGIWPGQGGVWVKYSETGAWVRLSSTAIDISAGVMRLNGAAGMGAAGAPILKEPIGGVAEGPNLKGAKADLSDIGPGGSRFAPREQKNLVPRAGAKGAALGRIAGPGEPGFKAAQQPNLVPVKGADKKQSKARIDK